MVQNRFKIQKITLGYLFFLSYLGYGYAQSDSEKKIRILFLGDSLTQGYGVKAQESFPSLVKQKLEEDLKRPVEIINAGSSGATTAGGKKRLLWQLEKKTGLKPNYLVLALGANDGLRGLPPLHVAKNLEDIMDVALKEKISILLCGMKIPPSHGPSYSQKFADVFHRLAQRKNVDFLPFLLEGVAAVDKLNQEDGFHPNAEGHKVIAHLVAKALKPLIGKK